MVNILLIGLGPHAKRIYYPISKREGKKMNFKIAAVVDLESENKDISRYLEEQNDLDLPKYLIPPRLVSNDKLSQIVLKKLNALAEGHNIKGVIISTEPRFHVVYAKWALNKGLSILMDKPISTYDNVSTSLSAVEKIKTDYASLMKLYDRSKKKHNNLSFSLMAQRRWHPAYIKIKELLSEVFISTNCPVTSVQTFHGDGQWRLPAEIVDLDYHSFNHGFGKCSHSGYHFFDIVPWIMESAEADNKRVDNVDVFTNFTRPNDYLKQITLDDYKKFFRGFDKYNKYELHDLNRKYKEFGEIDAFSSFAFKHGKGTMTLASINLAHNSFSQRGWLQANMKDLYKGNGRLRHESHFIEQGPFQAISFDSYQSKEVNPKLKQGLYDVGGEYHLDIHVFRNNSYNKKWKSYTKYSIKDLNTRKMSGHSRGHQEDARREAVIEFVRCLQGKKVAPTSDLSDHYKSTMLLYGVYKSAVNRYLNKNPLINVAF
ncbi:MAG: Gfo/Idh/MocA family oxidoreductase [bacterium]|nr:Gfo/Idh/MocA family oxidoreductase [bacterium]